MSISTEALTRKAWQVLLDDREALELPDLAIQTVPEFLASAEQKPMSRQDKEAILDQAVLILQNFYAHLPYKQQHFKTDPFEILQTIRSQIARMTELAFHSGVQLAFAQV